MISRVTGLWLAFSFLLPLPAVLAAGKQFEVMAPDCRQSDLKGKPHKVTERSFESKDGKQAKLESFEESEYDQDGNLLRTETFDSANRKTAFEIRRYDADGTWITLVEMSDGAETSSQIFIDPKTKRIAKVNAKSKQTEFITYTERGFEAGTITQTSAGRVVEKATFTRNANDKEERVVFEEPAGTKTTEILVEWTEQGFEKTMTMIQHQEGDRFVSTYEYPDTDAAGNWLTQIETTVVHQKNGEKIPLPPKTVKRTITYHP